MVRLVLAVFVGGLIGLDREARAKAGGLRTHMLVSLGAAMFVIIPLQIQAPMSIDALSRVIQGVATGIGFLGAGEIIQQSEGKQGRWKVKGLTSAAAIWLTAVLGMAAGCGLLPLCLIGTVLGLIILGATKRLERLIPTESGDQDRNPPPPSG
ncbi:MAG: MgtC/SapB family protein [Aphanocapsa sp. GSE-SYN-MK-11-07L]|nr:MgtC/SapB family protein [Aphanocapsa sp. GSE-SYN-MK-11-07L]